MNPTRMTRVILTAACLVAAIALLTVGAEAVEVRWTAGGGNFSWKDGWNWHTGSAPVAGDKIVFDDNYTPGGNCGIDMAGATLNLGSASMGHGYGGRNWSYYDSATLTPNSNPLANPTDFNLGGYASLEAAAAASGQKLTVQAMDWSKTGTPRFFIPVEITGNFKNPENGLLEFYGPATVNVDDVPRNTGWTADLHYRNSATITTKNVAARGDGNDEETWFHGATNIGTLNQAGGKVYFESTATANIGTLNLSGSGQFITQIVPTIATTNWTGGTWVAAADGALPSAAPFSIPAGGVLRLDVAQTAQPMITVGNWGTLAGNMTNSDYGGAGQNVTFLNGGIHAPNPEAPTPLAKGDLAAGVGVWRGVTSYAGNHFAGDDGADPYVGFAFDRRTYSPTGEVQGTYTANPGSGDLAVRVANAANLHYIGPYWIGDGTSTTANFEMKDANSYIGLRRHFNEGSNDPNRILTFNLTRAPGAEYRNILTTTQQTGVYPDQTLNITGGAIGDLNAMKSRFEGSLTLTDGTWAMGNDFTAADTGTLTLAGRTVMQLPTADKANNDFIEALGSRFSYSGLPMVTFADKNGGPFIYQFDLDQTASGTTPELAKFLASVDYGSNHYHDVDIGGDGLLIGDGKFLCDAGTTNATDSYVAHNTTGTMPKILPGQPGAITMGFAAIVKNLAIGLEVDAPDAIVQIGTADPNRLITPGGAGFTPAGIPTKKVTFQQNVAANGVAVESGTGQFNQDLNINTLSVRSGATLVMAGGKTATVNQKLSGTGIWTGGNGVLLAPGATVAPGYSVGELNQGGELLQFSDSIVYEWELADATGGPGIGWDMLWGDPLRFVGDPSQGMIIEILDAGLTGELDGSEIFAIAAGSFEIPPELLAQVDCRTTVPGWDAGGCQVFPVLDDPDFNGEDVLYLTGLVVREGPGPDIIPEPATLSLLGLGALALLRRRRRR